MRPVPEPVGTAYGVPGKMWAAGHHTGVDFLAPIGTPAKAAAAGEVIIAAASSHYSVPKRGEKYGAYGLHVVIRATIGGRAYDILYAHLARTRVQVGDHVALGDVVGLTGDSGNVTGPHLHFEVRVAPYTYGHDVNPDVALEVEPPPARRRRVRGAKVVAVLQALRALRRARKGRPGARHAQDAIDKVKHDFPGSLQ